MLSRHVRKSLPAKVHASESEDGARGSSQEADVDVIKEAQKIISKVQQSFLSEELGLLAFDHRTRASAKPSARLLRQSTRNASRDFGTRLMHTSRAERVECESHSSLPGFTFH